MCRRHSKHDFRVTLISHLSSSALNVTTQCLSLFDKLLIHEMLLGLVFDMLLMSCA
jgi:hypothetical protein